MGLRASIYALAVGIMAAASLALLAPTPGRTAAQCARLDKPGMSAVVICPPGSSETDWREAGRAACASSGPCHAWIWTDPAKAPKKPITPDSPMTGEQFEAATALWVDYTQTLFICDGVRC
jgi:hypothetical protein